MERTDATVADLVGKTTKGKIMKGLCALCGRLASALLLLFVALAPALTVAGVPAAMADDAGAGVVAQGRAPVATQSQPAAQSQAPRNQQDQNQPPAPPVLSVEPTTAEGAQEASQRLAAWGAELDRIEKGLKRDKADDDDFNRLRDQLESVRRELAAFIVELTPRLDAAQAQLAKLAAPSPEDATSEPAAAAVERKNLGALVGALKGATGGAEALQVRSGQLLDHLQNRRRQLFTGGLLERAPLFSRGLWREVFSAGPNAYDQLSAIFAIWWKGLDSRLGFLLIGGLCVLAWGALSVVCRKIITHFRAGTFAEGEAPPLWRRAASAAWVIILRATPTAISAGVFFVCMTEFRLVSETLEPIAYALALAISVVALVSALAATLLSPHEPQWRIFPASDRAARRIHVLAIVLASVYGADLLFEALNGVAHAPEALYIAKSFTTDLVFGALMASILITARNGVVHHHGAESVGAKAPWILVLRIPLWAAAAAILASALTGHVALARFLAAQVVVTSVILVIVYLLLIWTDVLNHAIVDEDMPVGRRLRDAQLDQRRRKQIALPITLGLQAAIILAAIPLVLLQWGFDQKDIRDWFAKAFFGFQLGKIVISPATIMGAAIVFAVGYLIAQFLRSWIDRQVLVPAGVTGGARDSIRTGVGYLGVSLAAVMAFSYVGVDSSHIALVAGALSLGIGFGLQSIVNNFVSGLILLAERPIKIGDWIVVHGEEGFVRRISVRTTEIETHDHSNVIVPNSMLISERLKNWTLHNSTGRVVIPVGVSYESDPELVRSLLLKAARSHPKVLSWPEPFVYFSDFGASAMEFKLFVFLVDIKLLFQVRTDLRIAIWKVFREAGVEIPVNQHDVHLRDLDWIKRAVVNQIARAREEAAAPPESAPLGLRKAK